MTGGCDGGDVGGFAGATGGTTGADDGFGNGLDGRVTNAAIGDSDGPRGSPTPDCFVAIAVEPPPPDGIGDITRPIPSEPALTMTGASLRGGNDGPPGAVTGATGSDDAPAWEARADAMEDAT